MAKCDECKKRKRAHHVRISVGKETIYDAELCEKCYEAVDSEEVRRKWDKVSKLERR